MNDLLGMTRLPRLTPNLFQPLAALVLLRLVSFSLNYIITLRVELSIREFSSNRHGASACYIQLLRFLWISVPLLEAMETRSFNY